MASIEELRSIRLEKLRRLREAKRDTYPIQSSRTNENIEAIEKFASLKKKKRVVLAGRVLSLRPHGGLVFITIHDGTAPFQILLKADSIGADEFSFVQSVVDIGDFIEATGILFITKRGEKTLEVREWRMLSKSLLPLPEKWHGLQDVEERFRKRYLDTIASPEVKIRFMLRAQIIRSLRTLLDGEGFLEVETPILQVHAGGATALPFKTHHNALDISLYLRIAPELYLKQLLVGGFPKVYELGRNFRNEGIDVTHNPEFTMLEYYEAYSDASAQMVFVEKLLKSVIKKTLKNMSVGFDSHTIDFGKKFPTITYAELLASHAGIKDISTVTRDDLVSVAQGAGVRVAPSDTREKLLDGIYKRLCRPNIIQPTFVTEYPVGMLPLAKRSDHNTAAVDAFQLIAGGIELVKAFSELNDPLDQRERFKKEEEAVKAGDAEAQTTDEAFLEALEHGMPPAGGVGIGIDRLVMLLSNTHNIREIILFPTLRPKR